MKISRRMLLGGGALALAGVAFPVGRWLTHREEPYRRSRFGALRPDPNGVLDLLEGFSYAIVERTGDSMSDGRPMPRRPDGMACFTGDEPGTLVLMRNHELPSGLAARVFGFGDLRESYDRDAAGGVTRVVLDARTFARRSSNLVLAGTVMNCSGGASPWGWLSCEEAGRDDPRHGFVFLCDPSASQVREPVRVDGYGRFRHEGAAIDPARAIAYLSEDHYDGCLYRFVPHDPSSPFEGTLQALRVHGRPGEPTATMRTGERREIDWVDLTDTTSDADDLRHRAQALGAAQFKRGEGIAMGAGSIYLCASAGGPVEGGQVFEIDDEGDGGTLEVFACSGDRRVMDMPDNVCMAPSGTLYFAEDGPDRDYVRAVTSDGEIADVARNALGEGELAGVCFSPDGRAMFVNLQEEGITLCVTGPFDQLVA